MVFHLKNLEQHKIMVFNLTSTQGTSHERFESCLINTLINNVDLRFKNDSSSNIEVICLRKKLSNVYIDSTRNVSKNGFPLYIEGGKNFQNSEQLQAP